MSAALTPLFAVAAGIMLVAGLAKVRSPGPAVAALTAIGLPAGPLAARAVGLLETGLGALCLLAPSRGTALALAAAYASLSGVLGFRLRQGDDNAPCGCFGELDAGVDPVHLALNVAALGICAAAAIAVPVQLTSSEATPLLDAVLAAGVACCVLLCHALVGLLPGAWRAYSPPGGRGGPA